MIRSILLLVMVLGVAAAQAQDALLRAKERARYLEDYKALLQDESEVVRLAAVEEALAGDDAQIRSMALEIAMGSSDERLQTTAIRWYLAARSQIPITFMMPERPTAPQQFIFEKWNGLILTNPTLVSPGDEITFQSRYQKGGQLIRGGMEFNFAHPTVGTCRLTIKAATGTRLAGQFHCTFTRQAKAAGGSEGAIPVRVDLS